MHDQQFYSANLTPRWWIDLTTMMQVEETAWKHIHKTGKRQEVTNSKPCQRENPISLDVQTTSPGMFTALAHTNASLALTMPHSRRWEAEAPNLFAEGVSIGDFPPLLSMPSAACINHK
jgi:hypothetical protein